LKEWDLLDVWRKRQKYLDKRDIKIEYCKPPFEKVGKQSKIQNLLNNSNNNHHALTH
jgi:hypothetical protein